MRKGISVVMMVLLLAVLSLAGNFFGNPASAVNALPIQELSSEEIDGLMQMREEEKLARDVYLTLYDIWLYMIFGEYLLFIIFHNQNKLIWMQ